MSPQSYTSTAKLLHWAVVLAVVTLVWMGWVMTGEAMPLGPKFELYQLHKSVGICLFGVMIVRFLWRLTHRPPPLDELPAIERFAAVGAHWLLYGLLLLLPITGWMMVSASPIPIPTKVFGLVELPHLPALMEMVAEEKGVFFEMVKDYHGYIAYGLCALVGAHMLAALRHHFVLKDDIMARMLPSRLGALLLALAFAGVAFLIVSKSASAQGGAWVVDPSKSEIVFVGKAGGQVSKGNFESFTSEIAFDPDALDTVSVRTEIDMTSARLGAPDMDRMLAGPDWFDAENHPTGLFTASKAEQDGDGKYRLIGTLELKGQIQEVIVPFELSLEDGAASARAMLEIDRTAFGVGPSGAVMGMTIDQMVQVEITIVATRPSP